MFAFAACTNNTSTSGDDTMKHDTAAAPAPAPAPAPDTTAKKDTAKADMKKDEKKADEKAK
ncbi:MAG: hypothetical protein JNL57_05710 [Bacteroidetes bacterium]|nr:hypothetical protein [Bacteroidota bacterium]